MPAKKITSIIKRNAEARRQAAPRPISMVGAGSQGGMLTGMGTGGDRGQSAICQSTNFYKLGKQLRPLFK